MFTPGSGPVSTESASTSTPSAARRFGPVLGVAVLLLLVVVVVTWLRSRSGYDALPPLPDSSAQESSGAPTEAGSESGSVVPPTYASDKDADGLSDQEETERGTDAEKGDTDGDGVSDFEEVYIRGSDPLVITPRAPQPAPVQP